MIVNSFRSDPYIPCGTPVGMSIALLQFLGMLITLLQFLFYPLQALAIMCIAPIFYSFTAGLSYPVLVSWMQE
jgi:hypothetical protein